MGDEPDGDDSLGEKIRVTVMLPKKALDELVASNLTRSDYQNGIEAAVETQLEIDKVDECHIVKN